MKKARSTIPGADEGVAVLQFDAGGQGSFVRPNPLQAIEIVHGGVPCYTVEWRLAEVLNLLPSWGVVLGNIVPCVCAAATTNMRNFVSESLDQGQRWRWRWPVADTPEGALEVAYDVFFHSFQNLQPIRSHRTFRGVLSGVDPTLLLPPKT